MSDAFTPNLALTKPEPGTSENTWGTKLNENFDKIDAFASAYLRSVSALALGANQLVYATGSGTAATTPLTAFARSLLDDADAATARTTMGAVGTARQITAGDGLTGGGNLTADRTISVDSTVVRTSGAQSISGAKTFADSLTVNASNRMSMPFPGSATKELQYTGSTLGFYDRTNLRYDLSIDANGNLTPRGTMNASNLSGTLADALIPSNIVRQTRTLTGGDGITTAIGDLSADRTISVDSTVVRTSGAQSISGAKTFADSLTVNASNRMSMPFPGSATKELQYTGSTLGFYDRTNLRYDLSIDANGNLTPRGTMNASNLSGTVADEQLPSTAVRTSRNIAAGNGLTGGGNLTADRTLALGTPSSITSTSTNSVTATSHTHEISSATIRALTADSTVNQVGTYAMLRTGTSTGGVGPIRPGDTRAGSNLWYASASNNGGESETSIRPSGTWRCMGYTAFNQDATLWLRIS